MGWASELGLGWAWEAAKEEAAALNEADTGATTEELEAWELDEGVAALREVEIAELL